MKVSLTPAQVDRRLTGYGFAQLVVFILFSLAVKFYGFKGINMWFYNLTGVSSSLYKVSEIMGYVTLCLAGSMALIGLVQWIRRKSLWKVDWSILMLGLLYALVLVVYVVFEKIPISYRPDRSELSYPSSHTVLFMCVNVTVGFQFSRLLASKHDALDEKMAGFIVVAFIFFCLIGVAFRLCCGCHWLTDIVGGLLLSSSLLSFYFAII